MIDPSIEEKQKKILNDLRKNEEEEIVKILATRYGLEFIDLKNITINTEALRLISEEIAREAKMAVFDKAG